MLRHMLVAAMAFAQSPPAVTSTSMSVPVSPSVIATDMCAVDATGKGTLQLLVLWRGRPGWFMAGGGASGGGGSSAGGGSGPAGVAVHTAWFSHGGVNFGLRFEPASRRVWIQDREVDLRGGNVVLVDDVDEPSGPRVVGTVSIEPEYQAPIEANPSSMRAGPPSSHERPGPVPVQTFIRRSPELIEFLRCDVAWPGAPPVEARVFEMWCSAVRQP